MRGLILVIIYLSILFVVVKTFSFQRKVLLLSKQRLYAKSATPSVAYTEDPLCLGSPSSRGDKTAFDYTSDKGVTVTCQVESIKNDVAQNEIDSLVELLDDNKGETCRLYI